MLSLYQYEDPNSFLKEAWTQKRKTNPSFSIRSWAKQLGLSGHSQLHEMINGKREVPKKHIPKFVKSLGLNDKEGYFFETLIDFKKSKTNDEKIYYLERLKRISPKIKSLNVVELNTFKHIQSPLDTFILEMSVLKDFQLDPKYIKKRLIPDYTDYEIKDSITRLTNLKLLTKDENGNTIKTHQYLYSQIDKPDMALKEYHKAVNKLASDAIDKQDVKNREYNAYALNIKKENIPKAKKLIRNFLKDFAAEIEAEENSGESTYQLNLNLFEITKILEEKIK